MFLETQELGEVNGVIRIGCERRLGFQCSPYITATLAGLFDSYVMGQQSENRILSVMRSYVSSSALVIVIIRITLILSLIITSYLSYV